MANRIIKETVKTSDSIDQLSWFEECMFYRLIVTCDDYGCMDARPKILASTLFPLKDIRVKAIEDALRKFSTLELVALYEVNGKPFLRLKTWDRHQRVRDSKHKYPMPDDVAETCGNSPQLAATCGEPAETCSESQQQAARARAESQSQSVSQSLCIEDGEERAREGDYRHSGIGSLISTCLKAMTPRAWEELKVYMGEMPEDLIAWAVQTSCEHGGNNWAYVSKVLGGLSAAGIKTVEAAEKRSEEHRQKRGQHQQQTGKPSNIAQLNYSQREYPEQKPGELPDWYIRMLEDEQKADAAKKAGVQPEMPEWLAEMMIEEAAS